MKPLSIGEVARHAGLRTSALRYYEDCGLLPPPARIAGRRVYSPAILRRIGVLRFAQEAGFTLREIKTLMHGFGADVPLGARWQSLARKKIAELEERTRQIERMKQALARSLQCGCMRIEDCTLAPSDTRPAGLQRARHAPRR